MLLFHYILHFLLNFFLDLFFRLFLWLLFMFLRRFNFSVGRLNWTLATLFVACWNRSRSGFFDLDGLLCYSWCFRVMSRFYMFRLLVASMFFFLLMMLFTLLLLFTLDRFIRNLLICDYALIVGIGGTHTMSCSSSRFGLHVLIGWILI